jgi:Protein of unknown function (DUF2795)
MAVVPYPHCIQSLPCAGDWWEDLWICTPTPNGLERIMRVSVGLAVDPPEATLVNQTRVTKGVPPCAPWSTSDRLTHQRGGERMERSKSSVQVQEQGHYELFATTHQHRILVLNNKQWFAWVEGQQGEILIHSDADHQKDHMIQEGQFYLVDFEHDPTYKDMPHLFLQKGDRFEEVMLPNGLPTQKDHQKKLVKTDNTLPKDQLAEYLKHPVPPGPGESRMGRPGGGSIANVAHYLRGIAFPAGRKEVLSHARDQDAPKAVVDQLEQLDDRRFSNMAEVMKAVGNGDERHKSSDHRLPIEDYDELAVDEVRSRLEGLKPEELQVVRSYEKDHKNRKTLLSELDRRLKESHHA